MLNLLGSGRSQSGPASRPGHGTGGGGCDRLTAGLPAEATSRENAAPLGDDAGFGESPPSSAFVRRRRLIWSREHLTRKVPSVQPNSAAICAEVRPRSSRNGIRWGSIFRSRFELNAALYVTGGSLATDA